MFHGQWAKLTRVYEELAYSVHVLKWTESYKRYISYVSIVFVNENINHSPQIVIVVLLIERLKASENITIPTQNQR